MKMNKRSAKEVIDELVNEADNVKDLIVVRVDKDDTISYQTSSQRTTSLVGMLEIVKSYLVSASRDEYAKRKEEKSNEQE